MRTMGTRGEKRGGSQEGFSQIAGVENSYIFADDWDMPDGAELPLWMLGFLYWDRGELRSHSFYDAFLRIL